MERAQGHLASCSPNAWLNYYGNVNQKFFEESLKAIQADLVRMGELDDEGWTKLSKAFAKHTFRTKSKISSNENTVYSCMAEIATSICKSATLVMGKDHIGAQISKLTHQYNHALIGTLLGRKGVPNGQFVRKDAGATVAELLPPEQSSNREHIAPSGNTLILDCVSLEKYKLDDSVQNRRDARHFTVLVA
jgi:hypothetical protein